MNGLKRIGQYIKDWISSYVFEKKFPDDLEDKVYHPCAFFVENNKTTEIIFEDGCGYWVAYEPSRVGNNPPYVELFVSMINDEVIGVRLYGKLLTGRQVRSFNDAHKIKRA